MLIIILGLAAITISPVISGQGSSTNNVGVAAVEENAFVPAAEEARIVTVCSLKTW